jgi:pyrimidine deaminase RibD-like protein
MKILEFIESDYKIHNRPKLDKILVELCHHLIEKQHDNPEKYGMVAACVLDPENRTVLSVNEAAKDGTRRHAERVAIDSYVAKYGEIPEGSIIITTLSPCNEDDTEMADGRFGESCTDLINSSNVKKVYCGYIDPSQHNEHEEYTLEETGNSDINELCKKFADTFLDNDVSENFADGKNPGRKGLAKQSGVNTKASVSSLRNTAKHSTGEKQRMAHWLANMKAGRAKKK